MPDVWDAIARALGSPIEARTPAPWGSKNRTTLVELADGRRLVVQLYSERETARVRLRATEQLATPLRHHGVPVPLMIASDLDAPVPWSAFERLPGEPAYVACGDDLSGDNFPAVAREMGLLVRRFRELEPATFDLPHLWTDAEALSRAAQSWLADLEPYLPRAESAATRQIVRDLPILLADRPVVVCHGDFGPQNVLVVGDRVSGLLDWEDARLGDPLLDVAWWAWLVRAHTLHAFSRAWPGFLDAAGIDRAEPFFGERLFALIVLRLLETADAFRRSTPTKHSSWAARLSRTLTWRGRPLV